MLQKIETPSMYTYIFGTTDVKLFVTCLIFAYLGMFMRMIIDAHSRNPLTPYSPEVFSWKYFFNDNTTRFIANIFLIVLAVRFIPDPNFLGKPLTAYNAFVVGLGSDYLIQLFKSKEHAALGDTISDVQKK